MMLANVSPRRPPRPRTTTQQRKEETTLPPRVVVALGLLVVSLVLVMGIESADTPAGWSAWALAPAALMSLLGIWLVRVELRDPWGRR